MGLTRQYVQRPPAFEAVRITSENAEDVALWCGGSVERIGTNRLAIVHYERRNPFRRKKADAFSAAEGDYLVRNPDGDFMDMPESYFHEQMMEHPDA